MASEVEYLVGISCMTYNQSAYIVDALNGFVMQQTSFPYITVVVDDASTDGEQEVIKAYVDEYFDHSEESDFKQWETEDASWTFAHNKVNENCHIVVVYLKRNLFMDPEKKETVTKDWLNAKYIAICEGDDYWTDPMKLQKQVDFMEENPDYTMCFHGSEIKNESNREVLIHCDSIETREYFSHDVFPRWVPHTSSFLYRNGVPEKFPMRHPEWLKSGDTVLVLKCMHLGKVWGMSDHMSVYRMNNYSLMSRPDDAEAYIKHLKCFLLNFPKIDRYYCVMEICDYDYDKFMKNDGEKNRWYYLFDGIKTSPHYMWKLQRKRLIESARHIFRCLAKN